MIVQVGRITPSFRRLLLTEIEQLHKRFRHKLRDPKLQEAFDALIRVWSRDAPAMMQSNLHYPLDAMNLLANVHVRAELEQLETEIQKLQNQVSHARKRQASVRA
jgi:hypothetical protein